MHSKRIQEKVKEDYNNIAKSFSDSRVFPWKDFDLFLPYFQNNLSVLDLGCGNGRLLEFLNKHGYRKYLGIDQSEELIKFALKNHPKNKFVVCNMTSLGSELGKFDCIFAIASFHHVPPVEQLSVLKKWKRHLNDGGYLFMTNWNLHQKKYWPLWLRMILCPTYGFRGLLVPWRNDLKRYYFAFTKRRLSRLLKKAGYEIIFHDYVSNGESAKILSGKNILTIAKK